MSRTSLNRTAEPAHADISLAGGMTIRWKDDHRSHFGVDELRALCPCATCTDAHQTGEAPTKVELRSGGVPTGLRLERVEPAGRYALQLVFGDGHGAGLFTWEYLRANCRCAECRSLTGSERDRNPGVGNRT